MMASDLTAYFQTHTHRWLVTGVAGFIGSNLLEALLLHNQQVVGLDNFSTGHAANLNDVQHSVTPAQWKNFSFIEGDIRDFETCKRACEQVEFVLHQAALGSVPRSIEDPLLTNANNIDGFLHMLVASRDARVKRFVYAASSSTYGDHPALPKMEDITGKLLSPYAVTKYVNELYADVFKRNYGVDSIGLRYFNVFGKRQDPEGAYAAVIPQWIKAMIAGKPVSINGDGETSRDFCYIDNVVQANFLAALAAPDVAHSLYNIAVGESTTLNALYEMLREALLPTHPHLQSATPVYRDFRAGDVRHSLADISRAQTALGYSPLYRVKEGLKETLRWYLSRPA